MSVRLEIRDISVRYGQAVAVSDVSIALEQGEIGCLLGPSGCGKTSLLRAIAGFEPITQGSINLNGDCVASKTLQLPPESREIGMVFQDLALFPHLTVADNIAFGLKKRKQPQLGPRVDELLGLIGLHHASKRYPHELSGGQQQRVALARAIAPRPKLLLLDEPFSSLDTDLRAQLATEVRDILKRESVTAFFVTHEQNEAFAIADQIGVMHAGRLEQWDKAYNLYHRPKSRFVADFIGLGVFVPGQVSGSQGVNTELGFIPGSIDPAFQDGETIDLLVRPDDVLHNDRSLLTAVVTERQFRGAEYLYKLRLSSGGRLLCFAPSHHQHAIGEPIGIQLEVEHLVMFKTEKPNQT